MPVKVLYKGADYTACQEGYAIKERITEALNSGIHVWVDFESPRPDEVTVLSDVFRFHPLTIEDCLHGLQRPKVDEYPGYLFMVLHAPKDTERGGCFSPSEFDIYVSEKCIVTYHADKRPGLENLYRDYCEGRCWNERSTGYILQQVMRVVLDEYFPVIDGLEGRLDAIERHVFQRPDRGLLASAFRLRRSIYAMRKSLSPQREVLNVLLRRDYPFMAPEDRAYFMDVYDHVLRLIDFSENLHELLSNAMESYLSSTSNRLNEIMKVLTIISTIMMPLSLIAGIYGMNFVHMPELRWRFGYPLVLLLMLCVTGAMLAYFHRKKWL